MQKTIVEAYLVQIYTMDFRIAGLIHLPKHVGTEQHLNNANRPYLPVTEAMVYPSGYEFQTHKRPLGSSAEFLAVPKERILSVSGGRLPPDVATLQGLETRRFCLLFPDFMLRGDFHLPSHIRLSDYLKERADKPFHTLHKAELGVPIQGMAIDDTPKAESYEFLTVNFRSAGSVSEMAAKIEEQQKVFA